MEQWMIRQGDVVIVRADGVPETAQTVERDHGRLILAYGEVTGHAHAITESDAELLSTADTAERWLRVGSSGATVVHDEHGALAIPPGVYRVRIQREYSPEAIRNVAD